MKKLTASLLIGGSLLFGNMAMADDNVAEVKGNTAVDAQPQVVEKETVYQDLGLADAINLSLENNLDIKIADKTKAIYKNNYKAYSLKKLGSIKLTNHAYKANASDGSELAEYGYDSKYIKSLHNAGGIQLSIPILNTVLDAEISKAGLQSLNGKRNLQNKIEEITYLVQQNYHYITYYEQRAKDEQECLKEMQKHLELVSKKFKRGKCSGVEVYNAQVEVEKAKSELIEAKSNKRIYEEELRKVLNLDKNVVFNLTEKLSDFKISDADKDLLGKSTDELINLALANRQDLKIAEANVKIAKKDVTAAIGESLPSFNLIASNSWGTVNHTGFDAFARSLGYDTNTGLSTQERTIGVYAQIALDPSNMANVGTKKKTVELQKLTLEDKKRSIETEVTQTLMAIKKAMEKIKSNYMDVQLAKDSDALSAERFYKDLTYASVRIDARKELTRALTNYEYSLAEAKIQLAKLKRFIGTNITIK